MVSKLPAPPSSSFGDTWQRCLFAPATLGCSLPGRGDLGCREIQATTVAQTSPRRERLESEEPYSQENPSRVLPAGVACTPSAASDGGSLTEVQGPRPFQPEAKRVLGAGR